MSMAEVENRQGNMFEAGTEWDRIDPGEASQHGPAEANPMKRNELRGSLAAKLFWRFLNRLINLLPPREVPSAMLRPAKATCALGQRWRRSPAHHWSRCHHR